MKLFLVVMMLVAAAQQAPTNKQRYEKFLEQYNQRLIDQTTGKLAKAEQLLKAIKKRKTHGRQDRQAVRQEKNAVRDKIKVHKNDLARLNREKKSKRFTLTPGAFTIGSDLYVGLIGPLFKGRDATFSTVGRKGVLGVSTGIIVSYEIVQIIGDNEMLVSYTYTLTDTAWGPDTRTVEQPVLIRGMPMQGRANGQKLGLGGEYFEVTGTYAYATTLGAINTVFVIEPFDMTGIAP